MIRATDAWELYQMHIPSKSRNIRLGNISSFSTVVGLKSWNTLPNSTEGVLTPYNLQSSSRRLPITFLRAAVKALEQLTQDGKIKEKVYGKQKIYFADQSEFAAVGEADLKVLDIQLGGLGERFQNVQQSCRQMETELKELNNSMTTEEMSLEIATLNQECASHQERLKKIKSATNHVAPEDKEKVYNERKLLVKEWRKRKRMAVDLTDAVLEGYPKSRKQFFEEIGIETDEDHMVTVPDF
ncbi:homologous-pairing protein 2 homolog isoform X2 [Scyliorhinus torazame]|uniref:homologous-pairing protein 2 homolog isoform X2 n=1 Tax=Scyliorhinus torazame TaxID=75743 RepID=UPI003B5A2F5E